ncbi:hypothetical protein MDAP_001775 [Mitosporidium daphniae]|uniref:Uncharacterized protein n=1 Tax=Mitosporidium daphniae TaxID=1485682 RepID=A0A098VTU1_9MICR|nr:uncharacterized protein DI09_19p360 [Mitosporidium daphniae]KGG52254.1 hypothetical protein DI09_19p360 [Mitosporidium daphniae]|eukprot:XP_013238681.1 uncharacterized protein DI09_19p360 [Mitosporidium daphniae]
MTSPDKKDGSQDSSTFFEPCSSFFESSSSFFESSSSFFKPGSSFCAPENGELINTEEKQPYSNQFLSKLLSKYFLDPLLLYQTSKQAALKTPRYSIYLPHDSLVAREVTPSQNIDISTIKKQNFQSSTDCHQYFDYSVDSPFGHYDEYPRDYNSRSETSQASIPLKALFFAISVPTFAILIVFSFSYLSFEGEKINALKELLKEWNALESNGA